MEERWRTAFEKLFGELRSNHPADEWTFRLLDQLIAAAPQPAEAIQPTPPTTPEPPAVVQIDALNKENVESETAEMKTNEEEESQDDRNGDQTLENDTIGRDLMDGNPSDHQPETATNHQQIESEEVPSEEEEEKVDQPLEDDQQPVVDDNNSAPSGHEDNQVDEVALTDIQPDQTDDAQQGEMNGNADEPVLETGSSVGLEAQDEQVETEPTESIQNDVDSVPLETAQSDPPEIPVEQQQQEEINATLAVLDAAAATADDEETLPVQPNENGIPNDNDQPDPAVVQTNDDEEKFLNDSDELTDKSRQVNGDQSSDQDPPAKEVEEVAPVQISPSRPAAQRLGASSPQLATNGDASSSKKSAAKGQDNDLVRKPEWMRRPLVRKGSVGRFLGRMKETMQSKRFHPDRLPVVPPPQPEPPKRPPRRKTLANLDLSRESENFNQQHSFSSQQNTAPVTDFESKSATLRSNASDRKRKNSVGRFIGRVLSTRHLNATEGTPAEEAPLLQQPNPPPPPPPEEQQPARSPSAQRSPTPATTDKSIKGQAAMAVNDMGILIRRILRPKTANDEAKEKSSPQRPPLPAHQQRPAPIETDMDTLDNTVEEKPVIKTGKVHFQCQVYKRFSTCLC